MNVATAFPVADPSGVAEPRRVVQLLAARLGFSEERAGRAALIVSELATNLAKHARAGEVLLRPLTTAEGEPDGIEILSLDKGPGIPDVALSRRNGYSTAGTLGHGLGAVGRQADEFELYTHTSGTAMAARIWRRPPPPSRHRPLIEVAAVQVTKPGESVCGDAWAWRMREERLAVLVADGLGHGLLAHEAAEAAVRVFERVHESAPANVIAEVHASIRGTRGASVAALAADLRRGEARFAGVGNIGGAVLLPGGETHRMVSHTGTAGYRSTRIQELAYPMPRGATVILHSDGLLSGWNLIGYPGILSRSASLVAGLLYRDFSRRRDDVIVVVAKERPPADRNV